MCLALFLVAHENTYKWYFSHYFIPKWLMEHTRLYLFFTKKHFSKTMF